MRAYFDKFKRTMFPEIKNWNKDDPLKLKNKTFMDMETKQWFFFDPLPYKLVTYGGPTFFVINMGLVIAYFIHIERYDGIIIPGILFLIMIIKLIGSIKNRRMHRDYNFYKMYMQETI